MLCDILCAIIQQSILPLGYLLAYFAKESRDLDDAIGKNNYLFSIQEGYVDDEKNKPKDYISFCFPLVQEPSKQEFREPDQEVDRNQRGHEAMVHEKSHELHEFLASMQPKSPTLWQEKWKDFREMMAFDATLESAYSEAKRFERFLRLLDARPWSPAGEEARNQGKSATCNSICAILYKTILCSGTLMGHFARRSKDYESPIGYNNFYYCAQQGYLGDDAKCLASYWRSQ